MRTRVLFLSTFILLATSCGKGNKTVSGPNQGSNANAFTANILAQNGMPKSKDAVSFKQKKYYRTASGLKCSYIVDTDIVVTSSNNNQNIRLNIINQSTGTGRNPVRCPHRHPNMRNFNEPVVMSATEFVQKTAQKINRVLNPSVYCAENRNWCASHRLISKKDVNKYGIPSIYVEAEFQNKNGHVYNKKAYISKVSLLQNVFEFEMINTTIRTAQRVDFKTLKHNRRRRRRRR